jgi:hypothetical protein
LRKARGTYRYLQQPPQGARRPREREEKGIRQGLTRATSALILPSWSQRTGLLGKESRTLLKKFSALLAEKWKKPYSESCGYVNARMSIAMVNATHLCLQGSQIPMNQMSNGHPQWEDKAGLGTLGDYCTANRLNAPDFFFLPTLSPLNITSTECKKKKQSNLQLLSQSLTQLPATRETGNLQNIMESSSTRYS